MLSRLTLFLHEDENSPLASPLIPRAQTLGLICSTDNKFPDWTPTPETIHTLKRVQKLRLAGFGLSSAFLLFVLEHVLPQLAELDLSLDDDVSPTWLISHWPACVPNLAHLRLSLKWHVEAPATVVSILTKAPSLLRFHWHQYRFRPFHPLVAEFLHATGRSLLTSQ